MSDPFVAPGQWFKGSLHTHTTESDGAISPADNIRWHTEHGYDFVALTDHDRVTDPRRFCDPQIVTILGTELSLGVNGGGGPFHLVACGLPADFQTPKANSLTAQQGIDLVTGAGGFCFVAHPHWSSAPTEELAERTGILGIEVFNNGCDYENRTGLAETYWDDLLRRGRMAWGFATDDSHWRDPDHGGGWVMVKAAERSAEAIIAAITDGQFYASSGPTIEDITLDGKTLRIRCSPAKTIYWTEGTRGWSRHASGDTLLTEAEFTINQRRYLRVTVVDREGRCAWSNPIYPHGNR